MDNYSFLKVAAAVPEVSLADPTTNVQRIASLAKKAVERGVEVVVFPEMSLTGYSIGALATQPTLLRSVEEALHELEELSRHLPLTMCVGAPLRKEGGLYDCGVVIAEGRVQGVVPKIFLGGEAGMQEAMMFSSGAGIANSEIRVSGRKVPFGEDLVFEINGVKMAVELGDDVYQQLSHASVSAMRGAKVILNLGASWMSASHHAQLKNMIQTHSRSLMVGWVYASAGYGESTSQVVFDGDAMIAEGGEMLSVGERFVTHEKLVVADLDIERIEYKLSKRSKVQTTLAPYRTLELEVAMSPHAAGLDRRVSAHPFLPDDKEEQNARCEEIFMTQALGLVRRMQHTHARTAIVGVSGGLDSTLALLVMRKAFDLMNKPTEDIIGVTMPGFGTTGRTYQNALKMMQAMGISIREISIKKACEQHFEDIGLDAQDRSATYENGQARERTQILMDLANKEGGLVIGTGDLSELALGWCTYNGDQMSMYGVNASVPKTLVRSIVTWVALHVEDEVLKETLLDVVATPVSPELLPSDSEGNIQQKTEDLVGPYELHDFFLYHFLRSGYSPRKLLFMAEKAFEGEYSKAVILKWLKTFFRRFFTQQFKRSAMPDGAKTGTVSLSPHADWAMPSDAYSSVWLNELDTL